MFRVRVCFQVKFDDVQSLKGAFTKLLSILFNTRIVWNCFMECYVQRAQQSRTRQRKKVLNLGLTLRPQTKHIQYFNEGLDRSFVSTLYKKFVFFCTETLPVKN